MGTSAQGVFIKVTDTLVDYNASGNSGGIHTFSSGNAEMIRFLASGLVNIGETVESGSAGTGGKLLNVAQDFSTAYAGNVSTQWGGIQTVNYDDTSNRTATGLTFVHRSSSSGIAGVISTSAAADRADIRFITRGSGGIAQNMILSDDGNLGIGVDSPDSPLHVANGSAGSVTALSGSVVTIETSENNNFLSFLSPSAKNQGILFGDAAANWRGQIQYNHADNKMAFYQDAITHFQIASTGLSDLFSTTTALRIRTGGTGTSTQILSGAEGATNITNGTERIVIYANGNIQNTGGSYGTLSDEKLKENIVDATDKLDEIKKVKIRNFNFIGDSEKLIGVVAQEIETIFPALVDTVKDLDADGNQLETETKSVKSSIFIPILIKAMQEQQTLIEALTDRITALEA